MAWGRGGAGNIEEAQKQAPRALGKDRQYAEDFAPSAPLPKKTQQETAQAQEPCALKGRGGAGNYYSPSTLIRSGIFASTHANGEEPGNSLNPLKKTVTAAGVPVSNSGAYQGRGGAGNYLSSASAVAKEEEEMRRREETMRIKAEKDVELGLLKPSRAHLTGREEEGDRAALEEIALR